MSHSGKDNSNMLWKESNDCKYCIIFEKRKATENLRETEEHRDKLGGSHKTPWLSVAKSYTN